MPDVFAFPDATYRRRIELRPTAGVIDAEMQDYCHHFQVRVAHRNGVVESAEATGVRIPWETCAIGAGGVASLAGVSLDAAVDARTWAADRSGHCVHIVDLALLAVRHALDTEPTNFEAVVTPGSRRLRSATLVHNGRLVLEWSLDGEAVIAPDRFAGLSLRRESFFSWVRSRLSEWEVEPAVVLRRACHIGVGRGLDMDQYAFAADAHPPDDSCYTYRANVAFSAARSVGTSRATEIAFGSCVPNAEQSHSDVRGSANRRSQ